MPAPFPTRDELITFIRSAGPRVGKREIARAFHLDAEQKIELRALLKELEKEGVLARGRGRRYDEPGELPSVAVIEITGIDTDGETIARPPDRRLEAREGKVAVVAVDQRPWQREAGGIAGDDLQRVLRSGSPHDPGQAGRAR